jgi:hypothetical protein
MIKIFATVSLASLLYFVSQGFLFKEPSEALFLPALDSREEAVVKEEVPSAKPFSEYTSILNQRDIFASPFQLASGPQTTMSALVAAAPSVDLAQNYKVVGIMMDDYPEAVIEDIRNQQTLFLSKGDPLEGGTLEDIQEGKVIVSFNNQRLELVP